jgi:hypothetical protein
LSGFRTGRQPVTELAYDYQADPHTARFRAADGEPSTRRLRDARSINAAHLNACWIQRRAEIGPGVGKDDYYARRIFSAHLQRRRRDGERGTP